MLVGAAFHRTQFFSLSVSPRPHDLTRGPLLFLPPVSPPIPLSLRLLGFVLSSSFPTSFHIILLHDVWFPIELLVQVAIRVGSWARIAIGDHEEIPRRGLPSRVARPALLLLFLGILYPFCRNKMKYLNSVSGTQSDAAPVSGGGLSTAGSGPCAIARPRSSQRRVGARVEGKGPWVRLERSAARVVGLRGFYSNGYGAPVPEVLTAPVAYHVVVLRRSFRGSRDEVRGVPPATGEGRSCPPYLCQVGRMTADPPMLASGRAQSRQVGHVVGPDVQGHRDVANHDAGSTASTAVLVGDRLLVANVGDSRVVVCKGGRGESHMHLCFFFVVKLFLELDAAIAVSRDHKPDQTDERQRIEEAGGFVMWAGTYFFCKISLQLDCSDI
ncbi:hypothetical protein BHM03_00029162 [Ensete ventricosum]|uniref:protein-serine/threonine phosphatase n=1 Tax=Ensete ventricosum TaxID=4639 RepID=A0A445MI50_ENSVE|nr:hypothetical protein BHM03_00029162 [Ensete ventricosum]